jgi:hypothetical protein
MELVVKCHQHRTEPMEPGHQWMEPMEQTEPDHQWTEPKVDKECKDKDKWWDQLVENSMLA